MGLVAEAGASLLEPRHRGGVGVGPAGAQVGGAFAVAAREGAGLPRSPGDPVSLGRVPLLEAIVAGRGQDSYRGARLCGRIFILLVVPVEEFVEVSFDGPPRCQGIYR